MSRWASLALALCVGVAHAEEAKLETPPRLTRFVEAAIPAELEAIGHAEVTLTIDIDDKGKPTSVAVAKSAGAAFDDAAVAAAKQFEFSPGMSAGKPVPVRITYVYKFVYKAAPPPPPVEKPPPPPEGPALHGVLKQKGDRVPLPGVVVILDDGVAKDMTDNFGRFTLRGVEPGPHVLHLRGSALAKATDLKLKRLAPSDAEQSFYADGVLRYESRVRGQRPVEETVQQTLSGDELRRIPGTQGDLLKAVQNLPGVARAPFGGGQIVVWGSSPQDTRTYVDGVFIPTLFHFGGLRSTVNSEIVSALDFYPGGYGPDHGRGLGGVIEIETRKPRDDGYHGFVQLDLIDASAMFEAKVSKNVSIALGLRRSTIDAWLPLFTTKDIQINPAYYDYQAKLHWRASARDDFDLFAFGSDDQIKLLTSQPDPCLSAEFETHDYYHRLLLRYQHRFGKTTLTITPSFGYDQPFAFAATRCNQPITVDAHTWSYALRAVVRAPINDMLRIDGGIDFEGNKWTLAATAPAAGMPREGDTGFSMSSLVKSSADIWQNFTAPYLSVVLTPFGKRLTVTPSLRLDTYAIDTAGTTHVYAEWEPRLAVRWQIKSWVALKAALGMYHQPPDLTALFPKFGNPDVKPQQSVHYVLGADFQPTTTLHIEVAGFYKDMRNMIVRAQDPAAPPLENEGIGRVYGGELLVKQELWHNFYGWISYTVSRAERKDHPDQPWRLFQYDQTHIFTLVASYKLPRGFQLGIRFRYVTGNPYTPVLGSYFDAGEGSYHRVSGDVYSGRLEDFHQLDVRLDKTWAFRLWRFSLYLDIQNIYDHRSEEGVTYNYNSTQKEKVGGLPIIPSIGLRGEF